MQVFRYPTPIAGCVGHIQSDDGRMVVVFTAAGGVYVREMTSGGSVSGSFTFGQAAQEAPPWAPAAEAARLDLLVPNGIPPHTVPELFSLLAAFGCVTGDGRSRVTDLKIEMSPEVMSDVDKTHRGDDTAVVPVVGLDLLKLPMAKRE